MEKLGTKPIELAALPRTVEGVGRRCEMDVSAAVQHWFEFYHSAFSAFVRRAADLWTQFTRTELFASTSEGGSRALDLVALVICFTAVHAFWERVRRGLVRKLEDAKARRSKKSR